MARQTKKQRRRRTAGTATDAELYEALRHPLRGAILQDLTERTAGVTELHEIHGGNFNTVAYHVRKLAAFHCIEIVDVDRSHGGCKKLYRATVRPIRDTADDLALGRLSCESESIAITQKLFDEAAASIGRGLFDSNPDRSALRTRLTLDEEGFHQLGEFLLDAVDTMLAMQAESDARRSRTGAPALEITTGLLAFITRTD